MKTKNYVGNDVVDLTTSDAINYPTNIRYVRRVLATDEWNYFHSHSRDVSIFWMHWAAKEAVYKIVKKLEPAAIFSHNSYVLTIQELFSESASGFVNYHNTRFQVTFTITPVYIHCIATSAGAKGLIVSQVQELDQITHVPSIMSERELISVHSGESYLVRCLIKNMLKNISGCDYEIYRQPLAKNYGPPEAWMEGALCRNVDISMSHDGNYCAGLILFNR